MAKAPYRVTLGLGVLKSFVSDAAFDAATGLSPKQGDIYFNSTSNIYRYYTVDGWQTLSARLNRAIVRLFDDSLTTTPTGNQSIDGQMTSDGDLVVLSIHGTVPGIYAASTGLWTLVGVLINTDGTPVNGDSVYIQEGSVYALSSKTFDGSVWAGDSIAPGTVTNSTLRWSGSAWVENATVLTNNYLISSPDDVVVDAVKAANFNISATDKIAGTGDGGDLVFNSGSSAGGLDGDIKLNAYKIKLNAQNASDPATGSASEIYYNTTFNEFRYHDGATWQPMGSGSGSGSGFIKVRAHDAFSTSLPLGTVTIDGLNILDGQRVLFTASAFVNKNKIYQAVEAGGSGTGVTSWTLLSPYEASASLPVDGDSVYIQEGNYYADNLVLFDSLKFINLINNKVPVELDDDATDEVLMEFDTATFRKVFIEYSIERGTADIRTGLFSACAKNGASDFNDLPLAVLGDVGITFSVVMAGSIMRIRYSSTSTGNTASFGRTVRVW